MIFMGREFLIKSEEASTIGSYPGARSIEKLLQAGIIVLDKPSGPSCRIVDSYVKKILNIEKCSHGGTLDPRVTGVLVLALGNATKLMPILLNSRKEYIALMRLHKDVPEEKVRSVCNKFVGKIMQKPPKKSAVARKEREREIYYLEILEISGRDVLMKVGCEAGTYIRKLCSDIGENLGGAHMQELRRVSSGCFDESKAVKLEDLKDAYEFWKQGNKEYIKSMLYPMEKIADNMKVVIIKDSAVSNIANGAPLGVNGICRIERGIKKGDVVGMLTLNGEFVAFGNAVIDVDKIDRRKKQIIIKTDKVLIGKDSIDIYKAVCNERKK